LAQYELETEHLSIWAFILLITHPCFPGTSDPIRSAFWYFLTAVVVLVACIVSYLGLYRIVSSRTTLICHLACVLLILLVF
jgi:hypothetical protein